MKNAIDRIFTDINVLLLSIEKPCYLINNYNVDDRSDKITSSDICIYWGTSDAHRKAIHPFSVITVDSKGLISGFDDCMNSLRSLLPEK